MTQTRFEDRSLVEAWLKEPTWLQPVDEDRVAAIVHQTPQVRRWPPQVDLGRFVPMLNATKLVAASVILALVGGLLFTTLPTGPTAEPVPAAETATATATPSPEATSSVKAAESSRTIPPTGPTITLPDELPEGSQSGTIETPAGPLRWARVPMTDSSPTGLEAVVPWGDGVAAWEYGPGMYATSDGVTWEQIGSWPEAAWCCSASWRGQVGDTHVVVDVHSDRVHVGDAQTGWREIDASAMSKAPSDGWRRKRYVAASPRLADGRVVFEVAVTYRLPYKRLGIPVTQKDRTRAMKSLGGGRYALCGTGTGRASCRQVGEDAEWILRFEETPKGLAVFDDRTGKRIGLLEGAAADELYEGHSGQRRWVYAIENDAVVETDPPWPESGRRVVAPAGSIPILTQWDPRGEVPMTTAGVPSIAAEVPEHGYLEVSRFPDRLEAFSRDLRQEGIGRSWISFDGTDWVAAPTGVPSGAEPRWVGSGWLATRRANGSNERWLHLGDEWVSLGALGLPNGPEPRGFGNVTFFGGNDELWVLTHPVGTE